MGTSILYKNPIFQVITDNHYFVIVERAVENGVVVAVERSDGALLVARLFRQAIGGYSLEFPRGAIDDGETWREAGVREVQEETGHTTTELTYLGKMHSNTSLIRSHVVLTHAKLTSEPVTQIDGEVESVMWVSPEELEKMIQRGEITDSHTLSCYLLLKSQVSYLVPAE